MKLINILFKMKKLLILSLALLTLLTTSCATYNAPTRYQGRNLYKFHNTKRTVKKGKKARSVKFYALKKRTSYRHPAVPDIVRRELRQRKWSEDAGAGQSSK